MKTIATLESELIPILAHMESTGVRLDTEKLAQIGKEIAIKIDLLEKEIYEVTGEFFNVGSPKQVAEILF